MDLGLGILRAKQNTMLCFKVFLLVSFGFRQFVWSADVVGSSLFGKPTNQSSVLVSTIGQEVNFAATADLAIDGNASPYFGSKSCTHTKADVHPWWKVDLEVTHRLVKITLVNRADCCYNRLTGAVVRAGLNADFSQNAVCGSSVTSTQASIPGGYLLFVCDPPVAARYVSVDIDPSRPGVVLESGLSTLTLCEVMIEETPMEDCLKMTSLSLLGKPASQLSVWVGASDGSLLDNFAATADLAIDGNASPGFNFKSCTHTNGDEHPWWKVDLETTHRLGKITLVNRVDCCPHRMTGAVVRAGLNADLFQNAVCSSPVTSNQAAIPGGHLFFLCDPPVTARYVSVDIDPSRPGVVLESGLIDMTLCEVMVEEYLMECPQMTNHLVNGTRASREFTRIHKGTCVKNQRPLTTILAKSLLSCARKCKPDDKCWSFDYAPTTGRCRMYGERGEDLVLDSSELGCSVYAVVGCSVDTHCHGLYNDPA